MKGVVLSQLLAVGCLVYQLVGEISVALHQVHLLDQLSVLFWEYFDGRRVLFAGRTSGSLLARRRRLLISWEIDSLKLHSFIDAREDGQNILLGLEALSPLSDQLENFPLDLNAMNVRNRNPTYCRVHVLALHELDDCVHKFLGAHLHMERVPTLFHPLGCQDQRQVYNFWLFLLQFLFQDFDCFLGHLGLRRDGVNDLVVELVVGLRQVDAARLIDEQDQVLNRLRMLHP